MALRRARPPGKENRPALRACPRSLYPLLLPFPGGKAGRRSTTYFFRFFIGEGELISWLIMPPFCPDPLDELCFAFFCFALLFAMAVAPVSSVWEFCTLTGRGRNHVV